MLTDDIANRSSRSFGNWHLGGLLCYHSPMPMQPLIRRLRLCVVPSLSIVAATCSFTVASLSRADELLDKVNKSYVSIPTDKRSDLILLPLVSKMDPTPSQVASVRESQLLPADSPLFADARSWAEKPAQKAVIQAIATVGSGRKWKEAFAWGIPYGIEGLPTELVQTRMYSDLGDPPTLAAVKHLWLPELDRVACLVNVEATRLVAEGKPADALVLLLNWAAVGRQLADRELYAEAAAGFQYMIGAFTRMRDIAYLDMKGPRALTNASLRPIIADLEERGDKSIFDPDRIPFPTGDLEGASQLCSRVFGDRGRINDASFGATLTRLGASDFPLRHFSESARWRNAASAHADGTATTAKLSSVRSNFSVRWNSPSWFDKQVQAPSEYSRIDPARFALIQRAVPDLSVLEGRRMATRIELVATRQSLAVLAATYSRKGFPRQLSALRPEYLESVAFDPFSNELNTNQRKPLEYFIPMTERLGSDSRLDPKPHEMNVVPVEGEPFSVSLTSDTFVLFSVGADATKNGARRIQNTTLLAPGADYLVFPPVLSLYRQYLKDSGSLK